MWGKGELGNAFTNYFVRANLRQGRIGDLTSPGMASSLRASLRNIEHALCHRHGKAKPGFRVPLAGP